MRILETIQYSLARPEEGHIQFIECEFCGHESHIRYHQHMVPSSDLSDMFCSSCLKRSDGKHWDDVQLELKQPKPKQKATPGPWQYAETWRPPVGSMEQKTNTDGNVFWGYHITGCNENGGNVLPVLANVCNFPDNIKANARLITAAPELLEALENLLKVDDEWHGSVNSEMASARNVARAVIAKAKGG